MPAAEQLAREALRLADAEPRRALSAARHAAELGVAQSSPAARSIAARAIGLALYSLGDLDESLTALADAVRLGHRARSATLVAEARMTRAWVLAGRGRATSALRTIGLAVRALDGVEQARAVAQRATILHQLGRFEQALDDYATALLPLAEAHDHRWVAQIRLNRGIGFAHQGVLSQGIADLQVAETMSAELGLNLWVAVVRHNLGYVEVLRGDIPRALQYFDDAESAYRELGSHAGVGNVLRDRAELLLSARLIAEAHAAAEAAVQACLSEGRQAVVPEARLILARVLQMQGDVAGALAQARAAARDLDRLGQVQVAALARLMVIILRCDSPGRDPDTTRLPDLIDATGGLWPALSIEAGIAAGQAALRHRQAERADDLLARGAVGRARGPAILRSRAWYAEALRRRAHGDVRGAQSAAYAGLRLLDDYGAALGATDLRAHVAAHRFDLATLGLRIAVEQGAAVAALRWSERARASHLQRSPGRPPTDPLQAEALSELRLVVRDIEEHRVAGHASHALQQRRATLERRIRDDSRRHRTETSQALTLPTLPDLGRTLGEVALVEYVALDGTLYALSDVAGRVRLTRLGPVAPVLALADRLPFALHRLARRQARPAGQHAALSLLTTAAEALDRLMVRPLGELADRPLLIVPTRALQWLPWSILPSCAGRPITVSPSATLWCAALARPVTTGDVVVAAGPGLGGATAEAEAVAAIYGVDPLVGTSATARSVAAALDGASVAHLAAHGRVRADNPLFGSLRFADGPLMMYDLEQLHRAPHSVVVAACDAGRPVVPVGDELLGLTATLLARGTSQLVASVVPVLDVETMPLMTALHEALAAGAPMAQALAGAQQKTAALGPEGVATAAGFLCFGAGFVSPFAS